MIMLLTKKTLWTYIITSMVLFITILVNDAFGVGGGGGHPPCPVCYSWGYDDVLDEWGCYIWTCGNQQCCNGTCFDPSTTGCCNGVTYDLSSQACCGGAIQTKGGCMGCVNDNWVYTCGACQTCVDGNCKSCNEADPNKDCCNGACYDPATQGCCNGEIYDKSTQQCCYDTPDGSGYICDNIIINGTCCAGTCCPPDQCCDRPAVGPPGCTQRCTNSGQCDYGTLPENPGFSCGNEDPKSGGLCAKGVAGAVCAYNSFIATNCDAQCASCSPGCPSNYVCACRVTTPFYCTQHCYILVCQCTCDPCEGDIQRIGLHYECAP